MGVEKSQAAPKRITAFVGTGRKKHTYGAVREFLDRLEAIGNVETEIVPLTDYRIELCRGCKTCFEKGEEFCPLKDDRDVLVEKMKASDAVIFASPNYTFQVSGVMKAFLDRLGYVCHRPCFHGKTFTSLAVQGIYGGRDIVKYLDFVGGSFGYDVVKGSYSTAFEPITEKETRKRNERLAQHVERFHRALATQSLHVPSLMQLAVFRIGRTNMQLELDDSSRDYRYYAEHGWFDSDYWYPTRLGFVKRTAGSLFDAIGARIYRSRAAG